MSSFFSRLFRSSPGRLEDLSSSEEESGSSTTTRPRRQQMEPPFSLKVAKERQHIATEEKDYPPYGGATPGELLFSVAYVDFSVLDTLTNSEQAFLEELRQWGTLSMDKHKENSLVRRIPNTLRGLAWRTITGSVDIEKAQKDVYTELLKADKPDADQQITKDIDRTVEYANPRQKKSLFNVLHACAAKYSDLGYCQGMSYIAVLLLEVTGDENEAFWLFDQLIAKYALSGFWKDGLPLTRLYLYCLDRLIETMLPKLFSHMKDIDVTPFVLFSSWVSSL